MSRKKLDIIPNDINKPEVLRGAFSDAPTVGYSEYFQQSNNVNLNVVGSTSSSTASININPNTGINLNSNTQVSGTVSADGYLINGIPLAKVASSGNYTDLLNPPQLNGVYAQLNNSGGISQVWTGPQLFSKIQSSNTPQYPQDLITKSYGDSTYTISPASVNTLGGVIIPNSNSAVSTTVNGSLSVNVDSTTIKINSQNQLTVLPSTSGVQSIQNLDGSIQITGGLGANPIISLNVSHPNVWTQAQIFNQGISVTNGLSTDTFTVGGLPLSKVAISGKYTDLTGQPNLTMFASTNKTQSWTQTQSFGNAVTIPNPNQTINGLFTPVDPTDAAPKGYVDKQVSTLQSIINNLTLRLETLEQK